MEKWCGWYGTWKRRHSVCMLTKTTLAQRLPADLEEKIVRFHRFVMTSRRRADYPLSRMYNMDETPIRFELPSSRTLEFSGSRTVPVKSCGAEKRNFTVVLAVAADGTKLPRKPSSKASGHREIWLFRILFVFRYIKAGWMSGASENGSDRVYHVLSVPF